MPPTKAREKIEPKRVKPRTAATRLDLHYDTVHDLIASGIFTVIAPRGRGRGKPTFLLLEEVDAYAVGGEEAVRELRYGKSKRK